MKNGNESAYPSEKYVYNAHPMLGDVKVNIKTTGLTKREYFAGLAMQGLYSNHEWAKNLTEDDWDEYKERLVSSSIEIADELLKQLENETTK